MQQEVIYAVLKKTPTHVSLYVSVENVQILAKFSGNVLEETSMPLVEKLDIFTRESRMLRASLPSSGHRSVRLSHS